MRARQSETVHSTVSLAAPRRPLDGRSPRPHRSGYWTVGPRHWQLPLVSVSFLSHPCGSELGISGLLEELLLGETRTGMSSRPTMPLPEQLGSRSKCVTLPNLASEGSSARKSCLASTFTSVAPDLSTIVCRTLDRDGSRSHAKILLLCLRVFPDLADFSWRNLAMAARWVVLLPGAAQVSKMSPIVLR